MLRVRIRWWVQVSEATGSRTLACKDPHGGSQESRERVLVFPVELRVTEPTVCVASGCNLSSPLLPVKPKLHQFHTLGIFHLAGLWGTIERERLRTRHDKV